MSSNLGCAIGPKSTSHLLHWITETISLSYETCGVALLLRVRAHSTSSVVSSKALARVALLHFIW
ncbi:Origin recognition complex subunit 1 [Labeo rohita]|uniref:Origin recognition complex subunit 1 n=1 Tax=Labeo rohita TaxID=84645 RepID=A0ABQ8M3Z7_LABRO|nr:Origin recognition complex subunit 1 [Labeo rohita]